MFCNMCGKQISDSALFCPKCGNKMNLKNAVQSNNLSQNAKTKNKTGNSKIVFILLGVFIALFVIAGIITFIIINNPGSNEGIFTSKKDNQNIESSNVINLKENPFYPVIDQYQQALAWYHSFFMRYSSDTSPSEMTNNFIKSMKKSYNHFADLTDIPLKYSVSDINDDDNEELVVMDKNKYIFVCHHNETNNSFTYDSKINYSNCAFLNKIDEQGGWINFTDADMHKKFTGTIHVTTAKQRAADSNAHCQEFDHQEGPKWRQDTINNKYSSDDRYVVIQLDEQYEYPISQVTSVFPHKIFAIHLASEKEQSKNAKVEDFQAWTKFEGQSVTLDVDLTKCSAPSGLTGMGIDIFYPCSPDCIIK